MGRAEYTVEAVNQRLQDARVRVRLRQRGGTLSLVATLPPKPGDPRPRPYQQTIAIGVAASEAGLKRAEAEARRLGAAIALKEFDWSFYLEQDDPRFHTQHLISRFKAHYMGTHSLSEKTWEKHWVSVFKRLPQAEPLEVEALMQLVEATDRNTRHRRQTCEKLQQLVDFAGIKTNLLQYRGNYSSNRVQDRELPSDADIIKYRAQIPHPGWRSVYSLMAALGLRDHECFYLEWTPGGAKVLEGKTGSRLIFVTLYPEWEAEWNLRSALLPVLDKAGGYEYLSDRVGKAFKRYGIPWTPYTLRHCFAVRATNVFGYPIPVAAALLGHSPEVHMRTYQRHLTQHQMLQTSDRIMERSDRPLPPQPD